MQWLGKLGCIIETIYKIWVRLSIYLVEYVLIICFNCVSQQRTLLHIIGQLWHSRNRLKINISMIFVSKFNIFNFKSYKHLRSKTVKGANDFLNYLKFLLFIFSSDFLLMSSLPFNFLLSLLHWYLNVNIFGKVEKLQ